LLEEEEEKAASVTEMKGSTVPDNRWYNCINKKERKVSFNLCSPVVLDRQIPVGVEVGEALGEGVRPTEGKLVGWNLGIPVGEPLYCLL